MNSNRFSVEVLKESELVDAIKILNDSFDVMLMKLTGSKSNGKREGDRVAMRFYRPESISFALKDENKELRGVCFAQYMGTHVVIGPIGIDPRIDQAVSVFELMKKHTMDDLPKNITLNTVTFPHSPLHMASHWKVLDPLFPCPYFFKEIEASLKDLGNNKDLDFYSFSKVQDNIKPTYLRQIYDITNRVSKGYKLIDEIEHVQNFELGETFIVMDSKLNVLGFAICHFGNKSEAFSNHDLLIKHLHIDEEISDPKNIFLSLLSYIEKYALEHSYENVGLMASTGRRATIEALLESKYLISNIHTHWSSVNPYEDDKNNFQKQCDSRMKCISEIRPNQFVLSEMR